MTTRSGETITVERTGESVVVSIIGTRASAVCTMEPGQAWRLAEQLARAVARQGEHRQ